MQTHRVWGDTDMGQQRYISEVEHIYQPPTQTPGIVKKIVGENYRPRAQWLARQDPAKYKVNVNINASLTEQLLAQGYDDVLDNLGVAAQRGVVRFLNSQAYHQVSPCFPKEVRRDMVLRQIEENNRVNGAVFGSLWRPEIFFPPEMAYEPLLSETLAEAGIKATITDSVVYDVGRNGPTIPYDHIATVKGLPVFFRSGEWSNKFSQQYPYEAHPWSTTMSRRAHFDSLPVEKRAEIGTKNMERFTYDFTEAIKQWFKDGYVILAFDGETRGHHQPVYDPEFMDIYVERVNAAGLRPAHLEELLERYPVRKALEPCTNNPLCGSWSTNPEDIYKGIFYKIWKDPWNPVHTDFWKLVDDAIVAIQRQPSPEYRKELWRLFDKNTYSCAMWFAGGGNGTGDPELADLGINCVRNVIQAAAQSAERAA